MKKIYILLLLALTSLGSQSQVSVTFAVNMVNQVVSGDGVHIAGNFQNWNPSTTELLDENSDGIYTATLLIDINTTIQYKFINGISFDGAESVPASCGIDDGFGGYNRTIDVIDQDIVSLPICFGECVDCDTTPSPTNAITLKVNMNGQTVSPNGVHIAGNFQGWNPGSTLMTDANADGVYEVTVTTDEWANLSYKFINGNAWGAQENVPEACGLPDGTGGYNRILETGTYDVELPPVCFGTCDICLSEAESTVNVTFAVDMNNSSVIDNLVYLAGNFNDWMEGELLMTDSDNDGIYTYTAALAINSAIEYKFINGTTWELIEGPCVINENRGAYIASADVVLDTTCFASCDDCTEIVQPLQVSVTFLIDMNNEVVDANGVHIAGNFQGWSPSTSEMIDSNNDGIYEYTALVDTNATLLFKIINGNDWPLQETVPAACGQDDGFGAYNRLYQVGEVDVIYGPFCFSSCEACLPSVPVLVTFRVNMNNETISPDGVFIAGDFNDWDNSATQMSEYAPGLYQAVVVMNSGETTAYKFINGAEWAGAEVVPSDCGTADGFGGFNRSYTASNASETLDAICFAGCADCIVVPMVSLTLTVDLGNLTADPSGVHIGASFNNFSATATPMTEISSNVFSTTVEVPFNSTITYKFINGNAWTNSESVPFECGVDDGFGGYNRSITTDQSDISLDPVCFGSCAACIISVEENLTQNFQIYPNPAITNLQIKTDAALNTDLCIYSAQGQLVLAQKIQSSSNNVPVEQLAPGIYFVRIGEMSQPFIKE